MEEMSIEEARKVFQVRIERIEEELKLTKNNISLTYYNLEKQAIETILTKNKKLQKDVDNSISKDKIKEVLQKERNEIFSLTYVDEKQWKKFDEKLELINKIEKELLQEADK